MTKQNNSGYHERLIYFSLLVLRFVFIFTTGYIHPDEFFQSPSIASTIIFRPSEPLVHKSNMIPWEFKEQQRCVLFPMLVSGVPFYVIREWLVGRVLSEESLVYVLLFAPRLLLFIVSLFVDHCVARLIDNEEQGGKPEKERAKNASATRLRIKVIYACLWPVLLFHTRTFSNTLEAFVLVCLCGYCCDNSKRETRWIRSIVVGVICAVGLFVRFTFPMFAFSFVAYYLFVESWTSSKNNKSGKSRGVKYVWEVIRRSLLWLVGFCGMSFVCVWCDSVYYGQWTITPLNNLLYNMKTENLSLHTLHPRYLHSLVNLPMLYGPLLLAVVCKLIQKCSQIRYYRSSLFWTSLLSVIMGVGFLSLAPHQEPRFLLPCTLPLVILYYFLTRDDPPNKSFFLFKTKSIFAYALIVALFFGCFHQAGVLSSLFRVQSELHNTKPLEKLHVTFEGTYMPPMYLLLVNRRDSRLQLTDAKGSMSDLSCDQLLKRVCSQSNDTSSRHWLVTNRYSECAPIVHSLFPHISTEDLTSSIQSQFHLYILSLTC